MCIKSAFCLWKYVAKLETGTVAEVTGGDEVAVDLLSWWNDDVKLEKLMFVLILS